MTTEPKDAAGTAAPASASDNPPTKCGPRPLFLMERVQVIKSNSGDFFVSFDGDNGHGPFKTREKVEAYARKWRELLEAEPTQKGGAQ